MRGSPSVAELFATFAKIGLLSFGGPAAQISLMHRMLVEQRAWLSERQYLSAMSFCMLLPGPEAMQLATYAGWKLRGVWGGLLSGLLFVLPGAAIMLLLGIFYTQYGNMPAVQAVFSGVKAAVLMIVLQALVRISGQSLKQLAHWGIAVLAFVGLFFLSLPYPLIVVLAAFYGFVFLRREDILDAPAPLAKGSMKTALWTVVLGLGIWFVPVLLLGTFLQEQLLFDLSVFFSKLAVVTFGGAYAVLAYMSQDVVGQHGWLRAGEMIDGLGLAETTPGPLILVAEFVGFLAASKAGGLWWGILGAVITLWVTFVPCFLWIFSTARYIDWITAQPRLKNALSAITAAVVGVIFNLSIWFGLHTIFADIASIQHGIWTLWLPDWSSADGHVLILAMMSGVALLGFQWGIMPVLALSGLLGYLLSMI